MTTDLSALSDAELEATALVLGEQAQQITNATACVRQEQRRRVAVADEPAPLGEQGEAALAAAAAGAPAKLKEIAEWVAAVEAREAAAALEAEAAEKG